MHWYGDDGEVIPEHYSETSTSETVSEATTENTVATTPSSTVNVPESTIESSTIDESTSEKEAVPAFSSDLDTRTNETTNTIEEPINPSKSDSNQKVATLPSVDAQRRTAASSVTSQSLTTASTNASDERELPKNGSQTQQSLFLTFAGIGLLLAVLVWLPFETRRRNNPH